MTDLNSEFAVETFSGLFVDVADPEPSTIQLQDIAHALAQTCRYGGHCQHFYSVAAHAVFVSQRIERKGFSVRVQLAALHHDDAEAYLGDVPRPIKPLLGDAYEVLTERMNTAICKGLGLPFTEDELHTKDIKNADNWSLFVEARYLLPSEGRGWFNNEQGSYYWDMEDLPSRIIVPDYWHGEQTPHQAKRRYLKRHHELIERLA